MAFIQGIGGPELIIILMIILLLFGAKKLPDLAKALGSSMKEFKKATQDVQEDFKEAMDAADLKNPPPPGPNPPAATPQPPQPKTRSEAPPPGQ